MTTDAEKQIRITVARIQAKILALVLAVIFGLGLFLMTIWLVIKGGTDVGGHLQLLNQYFIGYSVTIGGAFIGFAYGALLGGVLGWVIGLIYNRIVAYRYRPSV